MTPFLRIFNLAFVRYDVAWRGYCSSTKHFDIIIGGGGLVGSTLAATIASNKTLGDKQVLLLEAAPKREPFDATGPFGKRVSAINNNSVALFKSINAYDYMQQRRVKPVKQMQVWESRSEARIQFQHDKFSKDVACIIENNVIIDAMHERLNECPNFQQENCARIKKAALPKQTQKGISEVTLHDGRQFTCDLLIGADGMNSVVRKHMGIEAYTTRYNRTGVVATLELSEASDNSVAWQRFTPTGAIALLPLDDKHSSLVWNATELQAKQLLRMPVTELIDSINGAFCRQHAHNELADQAVLGINTLCGEVEMPRQYPPRVCGVQEKSIASFPLGFLHALQYTCTGAAIVGDAAHRIHPLAGQGANLGFGDVSLLVEALARGAYAGARLADKQYLLEYEQKALAKNVPIVLGVHALHLLYATDFAPIVLMRSLGLQLTQNISAVKNVFMKQAMG